MEVLKLRMYFKGHFKKISITSSFIPANPHRLFSSRKEYTLENLKIRNFRERIPVLFDPSQQQQSLSSYKHD